MRNGENRGRMRHLEQSLTGWKEQVRRIERCRVCGNLSLRPIIHLGEQFLAGLFDDGRPENRLNQPVPLEMVYCDRSARPDACGLIQLRHTVPPQIMFRDYGYRSGVNTTMRTHLQALVKEVESRIKPSAGEIVVDIGANDGTGLLAYQESSLIRIGFEPSNAADDAEAKGVRIVRSFFTSDGGAKEFQKNFPGRKARVITTIAMFYDVDDPVGFCRQIHETLEGEGLWVLEMHYWGSVLETNGFDVICHEHLGYYSLETLKALFDRTGFEFYDVTFNPSNGGSVRCYLKKTGEGHRIPAENRDRIEQAFGWERDQRFNDSGRFEEFRRGVEGIRAEIQRVTEQVLREGKRIYGYGASTKGNVLLQYCGLGLQHLVAVADRNPAKWGRATPGTRIPICSEEEMRRARPDFLLILPWHFLPEFLEREKELRAQGTRFIVPLPRVRRI